MQDEVIKGKIAYIDPRYETRSFAEQKLVEVMKKCWALKPKDRIDIFQAVRLLREATEQLKEQKLLQN